MKVNEFNQLKREVKRGNLKGLKKEVIKDLTLKQAQALEDALLDIELNNEGNKILDILVEYIDSVALEEKKVANKKVIVKPQMKVVEEKKEKKEEKKEKKSKKLTDTIKVGDIIKFRVEGEEIEHPVKIIYISRYDIIAITKNEREVFKIRKIDFDKQIFEWKDRHGEEYNIIVTI